MPHSDGVCFAPVAPSVSEQLKRGSAKRANPSSFQSRTCSATIVVVTVVVVVVVVLVVAILSTWLSGQLGGGLAELFLRRIKQMKPDEEASNSAGY